MDVDKDMIHGANYYNTASKDLEYEAQEREMDYMNGDGFADEPDDIIEEDEEPINEEDAWTVIASHFKTRGLVGQQLDSYDVFMTNTMQVRLAQRLYVTILQKHN